MNRRLRRGLLCGIPLLAACATAPLFTSIGTNMSNPLTLAVDSTAMRAYILNSNDKYQYTDASLHVVDLTTIAAPTRVNSTTFTTYGGQMYLDSAAGALYFPDRASDDDTDTGDHLVRVDVNEASGAFLSLSTTDTNGNPFGAQFDSANSRLLVPTREGTLDVFDVSGATPVRTTQVNLIDQPLSDGSTVRSATLSELTLINNGTQAVVTNAAGGVFVLNVSEIGASGVLPVDYYISDVILPRGIARVGAAASRVVYVVSKDVENDEIVHRVRVLDLSTLDPSITNTTIGVLDKDDNALLTASVAVGENAQQVLVSPLRSQAYVSNYDADTITVIDTATHVVAATIATGDEPYGLAFYQQVAGSDTHVLVTNHGANTVSVIDLATNTIVGSYP